MNRLMRIRPSIAALTALCVAAVSAVSMFCSTASAGASTGQLAMLQDPTLSTRPTRDMQILRSLGVGVIRLDIAWNTVAPDPGSRTEPSGFTATNPASYPASNWAQYDNIIKAAKAAGVRVNVLVGGGAPLWATSTGAQSGYGPVWKPSATLYQQFVEAVGIRYSGTYRAGGSTLPRVNFWELWNEGNWGPSLSPQVQSGSSALVAAPVYRSLIDGAWTALHVTGHGSDTIVDGSLSPDGSAVLNPTSISPPLTFLRTVYCLNSSYQELRGSAASAVGCPTTSAGSAQFRANNPAWFSASGVGVHPYGYGNSPTKAAFPNANSVEFAEIPQLTAALKKIENAYGSHKRLAVYNTEYGYETRPPQTNKQFVKPAVGAQYLNEAEYLSWKNPQIATTDQYLLFDPNPKQSGYGAGGFATGLVYYSGKLSPSFYAYRMPVWMPTTKISSNRKLTVWGCARAAHFAQLDTHKAQYVEIQFSKSANGHFTNVKKVRITSVRGYFQSSVKFPSSGYVRLAWQYPRGDKKLADPLIPNQNWAYSRVTNIKIG